MPLQACLRFAIQGSTMKVFSAGNLTVSDWKRVFSSWTIEAAEKEGFVVPAKNKNGRMAKIKFRKFRLPNIETTFLFLNCAILPRVLCILLFLFITRRVCQSPFLIALFYQLSLVCYCFHS